MFQRIVENIISGAIERGEFKGLRGAGRPIDLSDYFETPPDLRVAYSVVRNAGLVPLEVELMREISALYQERETANSEEQRASHTRKIHDLRLRLNLLKEHRVATGHT